MFLVAEKSVKIAGNIRFRWLVLMGNCCMKPTDGDSDESRPNQKKKSNPFSKKGLGTRGGIKNVVLSNPTGNDICTQYTLGYELGRGEFGVTYLCTDKSTHVKYACKTISKKKLRTSVDIEDVRREVEIMKHLPRHLNIVTLKDTYEDNANVHLVMELCEGGELFDRIVARGHYTERAAAGVTKTIVEVVQVSRVVSRFLSHFHLFHTILRIQFHLFLLIFIPVVPSTWCNTS